MPPKKQPRRFGSEGAEIVAAKETSKKHEDPAVGDAEAAFAAAPLKINARYATSTEHHNPIELFTTVVRMARWEAYGLGIEPEHVWASRTVSRNSSAWKPDDIHVLSPFVGGAFGSRGSLTQRTAIVALASKKLCVRSSL